MAANSLILGKVLNIATTGFITSDAMCIEAWTQHAPTSTPSVVTIVDRQSQKRIMGVRVGANAAFAVNGLSLYAPAGLSTTVCSTALLTVYLR